MLSTNILWLWLPGPVNSTDRPTDHMSEVITYKFLSWNTNGLNQPTKRRKVLSFLRRHATDVAYLQESHLSDMDHEKLGKQWQGQIFYSSFTSQSRGVVILIRKGIPFQAEQVEKDRGGRYVMVSGFIGEQRVTMLNIYGPNQDDPTFYVNILLKVTGNPLRACNWRWF